MRAQAGDAACAVQTCEHALQAAAAIADAFTKAGAPRSIVEAQANAGDVAGAVQTCKQALRATAAIADVSVKANALGSIAEMQALAGDVSEARRTAATIGVVAQKAGAMQVIAALQLARKDAKGAVRSLDQAMNAVAMVEKKDPEGYLTRAVDIALLAADRVHAGHAQATLAWAAARSGNPVAKASALVGYAAAILRPSPCLALGTTLIFCAADSTPD